MGASTEQHRVPAGALAAGAKLGRYEILAKLAAGGMATVYVARMQGVAGFERLVAIKVLHSNLAHEDEFIRMFLDEARLAASIRHPNVVPTLDVNDSREAGHGYFLVMEYIEGDHLGALLSMASKAGERLPISVALRIVVDALAGLGAAHDLCDDTGKSLHLVHRDVSPHNIMVGRDGVVRLTDFGVAKAEDRLTNTRDGQVKGKLAYMAPEQASGIASDARSDLFSVGVILWESITGQRLFRAETTAATLHKLLTFDVPAPSSIDPALAPLDALLAKALSRHPSQRFPAADVFARAIEELAPQVGGLASLRAVARAVKQHAASKLQREQRLVDDALRALRPAEPITGERAAEEELSLSSASALSLTGLTDGSSHHSLSASKPSGIFSHQTAPDALRTGGRRPSEAAALGSLTASQASAVSETGRHTRPPARARMHSEPSGVMPANSPPSAARKGWSTASLLVTALLVAAGAFYLTFTRTPAPAARMPMLVPQAASQRIAAPAHVVTARTAEPSAVADESERPDSEVAPNLKARATEAHLARGRRDESTRWRRRARKDSSLEANAAAAAELDDTSADVIPNPYTTDSTL